MSDYKEDLEHKEITVETLRTPPIRIEPAPIGRRLAAGMIDSSILALLWVSLEVGSTRDLSALHSTLPSLNSIVYLAILVFVYHFSFEGIFAATPGKSALSLRILEKDGEPCSFRASFKRNLLRFLDWIPFFYILGAVAMLRSNERQRLGDKIAGTIVTRAPQKDINPPPAPFLFH